MSIQKSLLDKEETEMKQTRISHLWKSQLHPIMVNLQGGNT